MQALWEPFEHVISCSRVSGLQWWPFYLLRACMEICRLVWLKKSAKRRSQRDCLVSTHWS